MKDLFPSDVPVTLKVFLRSGFVKNCYYYISLNCAREHSTKEM